MSIPAYEETNRKPVLPWAMATERSPSIDRGECLLRGHAERILSKGFDEAAEIDRDLDAHADLRSTETAVAVFEPLTDSA